MSDDDDFVRITLRIPKDVHRQLTDAAGGKRSMNAEIITRLEGSFAPSRSSELDDIIQKERDRLAHLELLIDKAEKMLKPE